MVQHSTDFTILLLAWFQKNARPLPWRATNDPYSIWVSEAMLQQTRVETVIPYYHRFLEQFPTITALATAPEEKVLKAWEGLGYYRRARLLQQGAREVLTRHGGLIPADHEALASLPGVGPYMAGALASIAFNLPVPAVDGNVIRVVSRVLAWAEDAGTARSHRMINTWVAARFPRRKAREFTESLMELGATVCFPKNPCCPECPVRSHCQATKSNPEQFPVKKATKEIPMERRIVLRINWNGRHLLLRRPATGLLAGFWEYPNLPAKAGEDPLAFAQRWTAQNIGQSLEFVFLKTMTQVFTHRRWELEIFEAEWRGDTPPPDPAKGSWFSAEEEKSLPRVAFVRELNR